LSIDFTTIYNYQLKVTLRREAVVQVTITHLRVKSLSVQHAIMGRASNTGVATALMARIGHRGVVLKASLSLDFKGHRDNWNKFKSLKSLSTGAKRPIYSI
jgi:hypothetical protein